MQAVMLEAFLGASNRQSREDDKELTMSKNGSGARVLLYMHTMTKWVLV